mmetsp:Transcript_12952/g.34896  ORF Transcript_12952/g.34896 Transcript_12952/m.34896 type:complete len:119 (-) Transcript_12952:51-407(-)
MAEVEYVWNADFTLAGEFSKTGAREQAAAAAAMGSRRRLIRSASSMRMSGSVAAAVRTESGRSSGTASPTAGASAEHGAVRKFVKAFVPARWTKKSDLAEQRTDLLDRKEIAQLLRER